MRDTGASTDFAWETAIVCFHGQRLTRTEHIPRREIKASQIISVTCVLIKVHIDYSSSATVHIGDVFSNCIACKTAAGQPRPGTGIRRVVGTLISALTLGVQIEAVWNMKKINH